MELLVEKGVIEREDVRRRIDWLVSRSPADGARLVARAWVDLEFQGRLLADARLQRSSSASIPALAGRRRAREHRGRAPRGRMHALLLLPESFSARLRTGTRDCPTARERCLIRAACSRSSAWARGDVEVRVVDSTADIRYLVVPRPEGTEGMTENELAALVTRDTMIGVAEPAAPTAVA